MTKRKRQESELPKADKTLYVDHAEMTKVGIFPYLAREITSPELAAYTVANCAESPTKLSQYLDLKATTEELRAQAAAVHTGDLSRAESMLMGQATGLQSLFASLVNRAHGSELLSQFETYMRLALKAQSQCRATLATLSNIKNPPVVYARQANIAHGPQQVNNGTRAENYSAPTEQSGGPHELLQNSRTPAAPFGNDPSMETVGAVYRTAHATR
jgi:hypothetical protein